MRKTKVFVGFGNVYSSLPNVSSQDRDRYGKIFTKIGHYLSELECSFLFAGRKESLARVVIEEMSHTKGKEWTKNTIFTYLPDRTLRNEVSQESYVEIGRVLRKGDWIEERRKLILEDADIVLLSGGGRGSNQYPELASKKNKFVIPLPIGRGPIETLYSEFVSRYEHTVIGHDVFTIGDQSALPDEVAKAYVNIVKAALAKKINKAQAFLAMPFVSQFEEREDAEDVLRRVCKSHNIDLVVAKDTDGQSSLISEIVSGIENCSFLVAYLDENRPNVYFEAGYAKGLGKPVVFCHKATRDTSFDTNNFENVRWVSFRDLENKLNEKLVNLKEKKLIP